MVEQGFEVCRRAQIDNSQNGGSQGRRCALSEPHTQVHPRREYLEQSVGTAKIALMQELGVLDDILEVLPIPSALILTSEEEPAVMALEDFVETDFFLTLDSGCCDHIVDMAEVPGYAAVLHPSPGSQRNQQFVVGNGERVANRGQIKLRMKAKDEHGLLMSSVFQVVEITRPLMFVSRICDQDMVCIFEKTHARVVDSDGNTAARFDRDCGSYTCTMKLRRPEARNERDFARQER